MRVLGYMLMIIAALSLVLGLIGGPLTILGPMHNGGHNLHNRRPGVVESAVAVAVIASVLVLVSSRSARHH